MSNLEKAKAFIEAFSTRDIDVLLDFFADDAIYHNIPIDPVTGKEAIRATLELFLGSAEEVVFETPHLAETTAGVVLSERLDKFRFGDKWIALGVMGSMEFDSAGKITHWRDYFDMNQFQSQMAALAG